MSYDAAGCHRHFTFSAGMIYVMYSIGEKHTKKLMFFKAVNKLPRFLQSKDNSSFHKLQFFRPQKKSLGFWNKFEDSLKETENNRKLKNKLKLSLVTNYHDKMNCTQPCRSCPQLAP